MADSEIPGGFLPPEGYSVSGAGVKRDGLQVLTAAVWSMGPRDGSPASIGWQNGADGGEFDGVGLSGVGEVVSKLNGYITAGMEPQAREYIEALVIDTEAELARLAELSEIAYQRVRAEARKRLGLSLRTLDSEVARRRGDIGAPKQADQIVALAEDAELFHAADGVAYGDIEVNGHRETWPVRSTGFRRLLTRLYYEKTGGSPNSEALQSAYGVLEAKAHFDGPERAMHVRVGEHDGAIYLDLGDESWRAVEIDADGWRIVAEPPIRFRRSAGMKALPEPRAGGTIDALKDILNVKDDNDFVLVVAWLLAAMRGKGPFPVLVVSGEQGSAKSTFCALLRSLLDPNAAALRALPREDRDLFIAANNGHVLAFDNVSGVPAWMSDTLCRLATGGGFAARQLYSDQDEVLFDAARPIVLNGIEDFVTRPDLADRAVFLELEAIPEKKRRTEREVFADVDAVRADVLGALLDGVSRGIRQLPETRLETLPRMADFALWATACESALWDTPVFGDAYTANRATAVDTIIEANPFAAAVRSLMVGRTEWTGTATRLLDVLEDEAGDRVRKSRGWPKTPSVLGGYLRRSATTLRKLGIRIETARDAANRGITITAADANGAGREVF